FAYVINIDLLVSKIYYFFFWGAIGCVLPFLGIYYKQLGLSPLQCGLLIGIRPFIDTFGALIWSRLAHKKPINQIALVVSILAWAAVTFSISFILPMSNSCTTTDELQPKSNLTTVSVNTITFSSVGTNVMENYRNSTILLNQTNDQSIPTLDDKLVSGNNDHYPIIESTSSSSNHANPDQHSSNVHRREEKDKPQISLISFGYWPQPKLFLSLMLICCIGQILASPAQTLSDIATLAYLGQSVDKFGLQRLWGNLGWSLSTLLISVLLEDNFYLLPWCNPSTLGRNYQLCFYSFLIMMILAAITASQFKFKLNNASVDTYALHLVDENMAFLYEHQARPSGLFQFLTTVRIISFFIILWFLGCCYGVLFTFLYWYLEDYGGTPLLFGIATLVNQNSELIGYFLSDRLICTMGPIRLIYIALIANAARFIYISFVKQAWLILPVEILQGLTHALVWSASISYVYNLIPQHQFPKAIGILQSIYHGFGMASGAFLAGLLIHYYDTALVFRVYGIISI
ncbi:uncharacterized protein TRIADDRAFT_1695, partial [Trichoplax adhaerens]